MGDSDCEVSLMQEIEEYLDQTKELSERQRADCAVCSFNPEIKESTMMDNTKAENQGSYTLNLSCNILLGCPYCLFTSSDYMDMAQHQMSFHKDLVPMDGGFRAIYYDLNQTTPKV